MTESSESGKADDKNAAGVMPDRDGAFVAISRDDMDAMEKRSRTNLVNSLSGYKSANLLATQSRDGVGNLALISSVFHVGANPPLLGMLMRPHTVPRHSLENLLDTGVYTLNGVSASLIDAAHLSSARFEREESEFDACGLTPVDSGITAAPLSADSPATDAPDTPTAPYVLQSPLQIGLRLVEHHTLACNGTVVVIGEIMEVRLAGAAVADDGWLDLAALNIVTISGLDAYHEATLIDRLPYAKPGTLPGGAGDRD